MMANVLWTGLVVLLATGLAAQVAPPPETPAAVPATRPLMAALEGGPATTPATTTPGPRVALQIGRGDENWGQIVIELNVERAPLTVRNFLRYVDEGYYNGTIFHRIIANYLIQGGGYVSPTEPKRAGSHEPVKNEARNGLKNARYSVAMARARDPQSATSQFFINLDDNALLDFPSRDGWGYCVFGRVVGGQDVVDRIKAVPTQPNPSFRTEISQPLDPPMIKRAYRANAEPESKPAAGPKPQPAAPSGDIPAPAPAPVPPAPAPPADPPE